MEEVKYYHVADVKQNNKKNDNYTIVSLNLILFDLGMKKKLTKFAVIVVKCRKSKY